MEKRKIVRLLWWKGEIAESIGLSIRTIDRMISTGEFPKHDKIIRGRKAWKPQTIQNWIENS